MINDRSNRPATSRPVFESLESRTLLSTALPTAPAAALSSSDQSAVVSPLSKATTSGTVPTSIHLKIQSGFIGQAITFTVTVHCPPKFGPPTGTVVLRDHNVVFHTFDLSALNLPANTATATVSFTVPAGAGGKTWSFGPHRIVAQYSGNDQLHFSHNHAPVRIRTPKFTTLPDKVKYAIISPGTGPGATGGQPNVSSGQTVTLFYTGWLHRTGVIFDNSFQHGTTPFSFIIDHVVSVADPTSADPNHTKLVTQLDVIKGFNEGVKGMKVGETRVIVIPSALAYGTTGTSGVPKNSKLIFLLTMQSIT